MMAKTLLPPSQHGWHGCVGRRLSQRRSVLITWLVCLSCALSSADALTAVPNHSRYLEPLIVLNRPIRMCLSTFHHTAIVYTGLRVCVSFDQHMYQSIICTVYYDTHQWNSAQKESRAPEQQARNFATPHKCR